MSEYSLLKNQIFPFVPIRGIILFPGMIVPLIIGREKSVKAVDQAMLMGEKEIVFATQKDASIYEPTKEEIYETGIVGNIVQLLRGNDGTTKLLVDIIARAKITNLFDKDGYTASNIETLDSYFSEKGEVKFLVRSLKEKFTEYLKIVKKIPIEINELIDNIEEAGEIADLIAGQLNLKLDRKQQLLEELNVNKRITQIISILEEEIEYINVNQKINARVRNQIDKTQREYILNEQLKAIQKELGDEEGYKNDFDSLLKQIKNAKMSAEATEKAMSDLRKLRSLSTLSQEASVIKNYIDFLVSLPWDKTSKIRTNINEAEKILNRDHWGLEKIKERIIEYLAVFKRIKKLKSPIICLVGPPGVGKTSLARSIAEATGREYLRISLGGVHDEAEIRGHRRSYVGALPGKIINSIKKAKVNNPLILLDEIDKIGHDYRGDPSDALLEVLDPEQNKSFVDHYLEVEFDLSKVMFIATANSFNIPFPLLDRMEIIKLSGYTEDEKLNIAIKYLIPKIFNEHGVLENEIKITDEAIILIIREYTREAGVRNLEREIAKITRKVLKNIMTNKLKNVEINKENIKNYLGVRKYTFGEKENILIPGITIGLAYTEAGGDILHIEALPINGKGEIKLTGKLGQVMQESAYAAFSYVKFSANKYNIPLEKYSKNDIHIHVPEGATPKDGPSAGIALTTSIISALTEIPVKNNIAMTGEVTLRGKVLAIGGLKEKLLAAIRSGIDTAIIPKENEKDLEELPKNIKENIKIILVDQVEDAIKVALIKMPKKLYKKNSDNSEKLDKKIK